MMVAAAGALSVATAASAAATWSPETPAHTGPPAASGHGAAGALRLSVADELVKPHADLVAQQGGVAQARRSTELSTAQTHYSIAQWLAEHQQAAAQAARKAAAAQAARKAAAARAARAKAAAARSQGSSQQQAGTVALAPSGTPQQIARAMLGSFGWSASQFSCLEPLWAHESGWSVTAYNASSGAYGIPQALPGAKMASAGPDWQANAATQIRWGLRYIKGSYGSPCGAWNHALATGWY